MTCPHHADQCPILKCERIPFPCDKTAQWYVRFDTRDPMPRCDEHVPAAMSWATTNYVTRVPRELRGQ